MKILPINRYENKPVFKGYVVEDHNCGNTTYPQTNLYALERSGKRYDKTLGSYHPNPTYKIYYADPLEKITDKHRELYDYIAYDDEPRFPDINTEVSKSYFTEPYPYTQYKIEQYAKQMDEYKAYFYRMEMADRKHAGDYYNNLMHGINPEDSKEKLDYYNARINDAKYNQETVGNSLNIMNEAKEPINKKNDLGSKVYYLARDIERTKLEIPKADKEIKQRIKLESILDNEIKSLQERQTTYSNLLKLLLATQEETQEGLEFTKLAAEYNDRNLPYNESNKNLSKPIAVDSYLNAHQRLDIAGKDEMEEIDAIESKLSKVVLNLEKFTAQQQENKNILSDIKQYRKNLPLIIENLEKEFKQKTAEFEKAKADLIPLFDKLKNYFQSRGLKQIRY